MNEPKPRRCCGQLDPERAEFKRTRDAGLRARHAQRLAHWKATHPDQQLPERRQS